MHLQGRRSFGNHWNNNAPKHTINNVRFEHVWWPSTNPRQSCFRESWESEYSKIHYKQRAIQTLMVAGYKSNADDLWGIIGIWMIGNTLWTTYYLNTSAHRIQVQDSNPIGTQRNWRSIILLGTGTSGNTLLTTCYWSSSGDGTPIQGSRSFGHHWDWNAPKHTVNSVRFEH